MEFRIAGTFTDSLAKLTGDEQKAVKTAAFDLQLNPAHPALQFHKLDKAKDPAGGGVAPHEVGIFVRSTAELDRARAAAQDAGIPFQALDEDVETVTGRLSISTMHLAKGLEFRAVVVMACDDEIIPLQDRIETVADDSDLEEVYNTERHLLYVACTRARDHLMVTGVEPASEFLDDLRA
jgi:hypothetical protein